MVKFLKEWIAHMKKEREEYKKSWMHALTAPSEIADKHFNSWRGMDYVMLEMEGPLIDCSRFDVYIHSIQLPFYQYGKTLSDLDVTKLNICIRGDIFRGALYEEPIFENDWKNMPELTSYHEHIRKECGIEGDVFIPFFSTETILDANSRSRATISGYNKHKEEIEDMLDRIEKDRQAILDTRDIWERQALLSSWGLSYIKSDD